MIQEADLVSACAAVSAKYGEDMGQDVAVTLLKWDRHGTLKAHDSLSLLKLALHCGLLAAKHRRQPSFPDNRTTNVNEGFQKDYSELSFWGIGRDELVRNESVADRMGLCRLRQLLLAPKNRRVVFHALRLDKDTSLSRARYSQLLAPFKQAGYVKRKANKRRRSNFNKVPS